MESGIQDLDCDAQTRLFKGTGYWTLLMER